jgi:predicted enzyme related to lactoylglutathione lyase
MNKVMWFDIPANNIDASAVFYQNVFGWTVIDRHPDDNADALSFRIAQTAESDGPMSKVSGAINGGLVTRDIGITQPTILIEVPNIDLKVKEVEAAGGFSVAAKRELPLAGGSFAYVQDLDGNVIGLWEWTAS